MGADARVLGERPRGGSWIPYLLPSLSSPGIAEAMKPQKPGKPSLSLYSHCDIVIYKKKYVCLVFLTFLVLCS